MSKKLLIPLVVFVVLTGFLFVGLFRDPREVPSPLVGKPAPAFTLVRLHEPDKKLGTADLKGQVWLLNVWASWCVSCREEHPVLLALAKGGAVPVYGLNYKDQRNDGIAWLDKMGNPYRLSAFDADGRVGIDYGVYGVPETYLIDKHGVIRLKRIGILTPDYLEQKLLPLVDALKRES
ncbi:MAG TPA: DsbE family thiol:disulfide interchange protein [Burkholderiales bacterium]|nr:DsbE family thiol:disulfide interchange protein [Burkholderiales bacterium]